MSDNVLKNEIREMLSGLPAAAIEHALSCPVQLLANIDQWDKEIEEESKSKQCLRPNCENYND